MNTYVTVLLYKYFVYFTKDDGRICYVVITLWALATPVELGDGFVAFKVQSRVAFKGELTFSCKMVILKWH